MSAVPDELAGLVDLLPALRTGEAIMSTVREPILLLSAELKVIRANRAFCDVFRAPQKETEGKYVYELQDRQWDIPGLRQLLENVLPEQENFEERPRTILEEPRFCAARSIPSHMSFAVTTARWTGSPLFSETASTRENRYCSLLLNN